MKNSVKTIKIKHILLSVVLMLACLCSDAQYYYGSPPPPPRRERPSKPQPPENNDENPQQPTGYLSINYGLALPESNFAIGFGTAYGGYALPGSVFHFSLAFPINHSNFGVALMYGGYDNIYDINTYVNNLNNSNSNLQYEAATGSSNIYSESSIMGGLFFTYPIGRLSIDGRLMLGALLCNFPEQDYAYADAQGDVFENDLQSSYSTGLAFDAGIGLRYLIVRFGSRPLCVLLNADFLYSNPHYNTIQNLYETPVSGQYANTTVQIVPSPSYSGHLPISLLNFSLGLGYQLGK